MPLLWRMMCLFVVNALGRVAGHDLYSAIPVGNQYYLVTRPNREVRLVPDAQSLELLDPFILPAVSSLEELRMSYLVRDPLPLFVYKDKSPDECIRVYFLKSDVLNGNDIFISYKNVGEYVNPSVLHFRGRLLMVVPLQIGPTGTEHRKATGTIEFKWLNDSFLPFYTTGPYLGIENEVHRLNIPFFVGEDPRVLFYNDSFFQVFSTFSMIWTGPHHQKMGLADVRYLDSEDRVNITYLASPIMGKAPIDMSVNQKNWSPFLHNGEPLLVQSIHPLVIVQLHGYGSPDIVASVKGRADYPLSHKLGTLRGGTNAIPLSDNTYFAFYHIRARLPWSGMNSYVYGAYVFSVEPYAMLKISPTPIMEPRELFTGAWASRYIDYCVYPMYISRISHDTLHLSFGHQDHFGFIATLNLTNILATLVAVK